MQWFSRAGGLMFLLTAAGGLNAQEAAAAGIQLKSGRVPPNQLSPEQGEAGLQRSLASARLGLAPGGRFHFLLQFSGPPGPAERAAIEQRGGAVVSYVPHNAWICALPPGFDPAGLNLTYAGLLEAENKLSPLFDVTGSSAVMALVEFHGDVEAGQAAALAGRAGLETINHPDVAHPFRMVRGPASDLKELAAADEVAYILPAAEALRSGEAVVGCLGGSVDGVAAAANLAARFGEGWDGPGLGSARLSYWLGAMAPGLDPGAVRAEILRALEQWKAAAALQFSPAAGAAQPKSIEIAFLPRDHGDGFRFDGRGGVLGHTFYPPPTAEPLAGDIHLDLEEPWRIGNDVDVYSVVLHEMGHALGLGHNDDPNSVMYPYYRRVNGLRPADVTEIRKLYAAPGQQAPPAPAPAPPPAPLPPAAPVQDTIAPSLSLNAVATLTSASSAVLRGVATDNVAVTSVTWATAGGQSGPAAGLPQFATPPIPLNPGLNRITVRARDAAGNESSRTVSITRR